MLSVKNITKSYNTGEQDISVLNNVSLEVQAGEFISITGRSGSGKSTLLNVLATLVRPDSGEVHYNGSDLAAMPDKALNAIRKTDFAVIFQFHHLLPYLTVLENTLLPFMGSLKPVGREVEIKARECLERVGLSDKINRLPGKLSGGEQQRVAIARALVKSSKVLFADEPTGSLDKTTGEQIMRLLTELHREGMTIAMVTHDPAYAGLAERTIEIEDGYIMQ